MALEEIGGWDMEIIYESGITAEAIVETTYQREYDFVIIDHVHRFAWGSERRKFETELMTLTNLALDFNIPVLALAQLRKTERGQGLLKYPRPSLQDFRETSLLGDEAAMVLAVWRKRMEDGITYDPSSSSEIIVLKDRFGPMGRSKFHRFDGARQMFVPEGGLHAVTEGMAQPDGTVVGSDGASTSPAWVSG